MSDLPLVEVYERRDGGFDWRLIGRNGEQLCESSQGYTERNDAHEGWRRVNRLIVEHFDQSGEITPVDVDANGQPLG